MNDIIDKIERDRALELVSKWIDGFRIRCIGGTVYGFKTGAEGSGRPIMLSGDACVARDTLSSMGIRMLRIDSGGAPEWEFKVTTEIASDMREAVKLSGGNLPEHQ